MPSANGPSTAAATSRRRTASTASAGPAPEGGAAAPAPEQREPVISLGAQLRDARKAAGLSLRQFARDLAVSPSFVSQIENGKSQPSVATLYTMCSKLNVSVDELFSRAGASGPDAASGAGPGPSPLPGARPDPAPRSRQGAIAGLNTPAGPAEPTGPVVTPGQRRRLVLDSGVTWEQLAPTREAAVDFLFVRYAVGGSSVASHEVTRHNGVEYGYIISGTLEITLGFETYRVHAGESISFDSTTPHRLTNAGDVPVEAIWFVHGRNASHEH